MRLAAAAGPSITPCHPRALPAILFRRHPVWFQYCTQSCQRSAQPVRIQAPRQRPPRPRSPPSAAAPRPRRRRPRPRRAWHGWPPPRRRPSWNRCGDSVAWPWAALPRRTHQASVATVSPMGARLARTRRRETRRRSLQARSRRLRAIPLRRRVGHTTWLPRLPSGRRSAVRRARPPRRVRVVRLPMRLLHDGLVVRRYPRRTLRPSRRRPSGAASHGRRARSVLRRRARRRHRPAR